MPRTSTTTILPLFDPKFTEQTREESNWKKYVKAGIILTALTGTFAVLRWWFGGDESSDLEEEQALALTGEKENQFALTDSSLESKDEDVIEVLSPAILREQREEGLRLAEFKELPMGEHNIARDLLNVTSLTNVSSTQISSSGSVFITTSPDNSENKRDWLVIILSILFSGAGCLIAVAIIKCVKKRCLEKTAQAESSSSQSLTERDSEGEHSLSDEERVSSDGCSGEVEDDEVCPAEDDGEGEAEPDLQTAPPEMLELQDRLVRACELGDLWGVQKLIKGENANPYMLPRRNGKHPFGAAIIGCNIEVVRYFDSIEYCQPATLERILDINKEKYPFDKGVPPKIRIRVEGTRWKEVYVLYTKHIIGKLGFFKIERESFVRKKWRIYHQFDDKALWICGMELCNENMLCIEYHNIYIPDTSSKGFVEGALMLLYSTVQHYAYEYVNLDSMVDDKYMDCIRAWNLCRHEVKQRLKPT